MLRKFIGKRFEQFGVNAMVEKSVDLDDVAGEHFAFAADAVLEQLHGKFLLVVCINNNYE